MELSKLRSHLNQEITEIEQHSKEIEHMFEKQSYQMKELEDKIKIIEDNFDFAYEAFSPVLQNSERSKQQISKLKEEQQNLCQSQELLQNQINDLKNKKEEVVTMLHELSFAEHKNEKRLKNIKANYDRMLGIRMIERQEQERQRIARDLHDTTVQNLTAMIHKMEFCQQIMDADPIRAKLEMQLMINTIRESVDDMREVIYNLRPMSFDDIGFKETLLRTVEKLRKNTDININFAIDGEVYPMVPAYELTILRIIQESFNNSKKYSQAEQVNIALKYEENQIILKIQDNGNGFDMEEKKEDQQNSGFGISMMKERVYLLKGQLNIQSKKDMGTEIEVILPKKELEETDED